MKCWCWLGLTKKKLLDKFAQLHHTNARFYLRKKNIINQLKDSRILYETNPHSFELAQFEVFFLTTNIFEVVDFFDVLNRRTKYLAFLCRFQHFSSHCMLAAGNCYTKKETRHKIVKYFSNHWKKIDVGPLMSRYILYILDFLGEIFFWRL